MGNQGLPQDHAFVAPGSVRPARPLLVLLTALVTTLVSAAACTTAILTRPPAAAIPFLVAICVGGPIFGGWNVPGAIAALRVERVGTALVKFRRSLDALPETEHPLGF